MVVYLCGMDKDIHFITDDGKVSVSKEVVQEMRALTPLFEDNIGSDEEGIPVPYLLKEIQLLVQHAERIQGSKNGYCSSLKNDSLEKKLTVLKLAAFVNHSGLYECLLKQIGQDLSDKNALQDMYTNLAGVKKLSLGRDTEKILAEKIIDEVAITATTELASRQMGMQQIDVSYDGNYIVHLAEGNIALMPTNRAAGAVRNEKLSMLNLILLTKISYCSSTPQVP